MTPVIDFQLASGSNLCTVLGFRPGKNPEPDLSLSSPTPADGSLSLPIPFVDWESDEAPRGGFGGRPRPGELKDWDELVLEMAPDEDVAGVPREASKAGDWVVGWRSASARSSRRGKPEVAPCHFLRRETGREGGMSSFASEAQL